MTTTPPTWQPEDAEPEVDPAAEPVESPVGRPSTTEAGTGAEAAAAPAAVVLAPAAVPARVAESGHTWLLALAAVTGVAAFLYLWNLTVSGYANAYYSAAALAASQSWSAWFFGSFDANNFITVDKPPLSTMLMGLSVRLFGLSSWSVLLPEALAGVATVGALFMVVRRSFGTAAATIAALVMALTPAAVLMFRFNNPDGLLTLLFVLSAWALLHAIDRGSLRWMCLAAILVGLAFLTKYLQAYLVLPSFALVFGLSANTTLRRRVAGLALALVTVVVASGWWVAIVQLLPADMRPFIGGSENGEPVDLILGYNGLGRIFGNGGPGGGGGANFSGSPDLLRLFNGQMFGEIAWFIPLAVVSLMVGLWLRRRAPRTDAGLAGYVLWGGWFLVTALVFSYMSGVIHSYYAVALAPAVAALVGAGLVDMWRMRVRAWVGGVAVGIALLATALFGATLLDRTAGFAQGVGTAAIVLAAVALLVLILLSLPRVTANATARRLGAGAAAIGVVATLLGPSAYAWTTIQTAYGGGDPHPGPGAASGFGRGNLPGGTLPGNGGQDGGRPGLPGNGGLPDGGLPGNGGGLPGGGGGFPGSGNATNDSALLDYLVKNRGDALWIVAANGSGEAGQIEIATGLPVMAMGGFTGSDPAPSLGQLKTYIASGKLRYVLIGGNGSGFFAGSSNDRTSWVTSTCKPVSYGTGTGAALYDCAGAG
jgi:4-amino-4-deoxy-L-arabinose transferase-like glycosyltransferase